MAEDIMHTTHYDNGYHICTCGTRFARGDKHPKTITKVQVILFKESGKYYTEEFWRIPEIVNDYSDHRGNFTREAIIPYDMKQSPDFRRIDNGPVLIPSQEPWGYPQIFPEEKA